MAIIYKHVQINTEPVSLKKKVLFDKIPMNCLTLFTLDGLFSKVYTGIRNYITVLENILYEIMAPNSVSFQCKQKCYLTNRQIQHKYYCHIRHMKS